MLKGSGRHIAGSGYKANLGILTLKEREELGKLPLSGSGIPLKFDRGARNGYTSAHE